MSELGNRFHQFSRWLSLFFSLSFFLVCGNKVTASLVPPLCEHCCCTSPSPVSEQVVGGLTWPGLVWALLGSFTSASLYPSPAALSFRNSRIIWSIWPISAWSEETVVPGSVSGPERRWRRLQARPVQSTANRRVRANRLLLLATALLFSFLISSLELLFSFASFLRALGTHRRRGWEASVCVCMCVSVCAFQTKNCQGKKVWDCSDRKREKEADRGTEWQRKTTNWWGPSGTTQKSECELCRVKGHWWR